MSVVITYSCVATRENLHIALTITALHDLQIKAYVMVPNKEKILTALGPEFGDNAGKSTIIVRVLCKLKSAGASFRAHIVQCMQKWGYDSCEADPDLHWKPETRPQDICVLFIHITLCR